MAEQMAIPIDKEAIPYRFDIDLAGEIFTFEVHYNTRFDSFAVHLEKGGVKLVDGEKLVYGRALFSGLGDPELPKVSITPSDVAGDETRVGWDQLGETVYLFVGDVS